MKKNIAIFICILLICMLCGCSTASGTTSFIKEVGAGNYLKAQEIYNKKIMGNTQSEVEAKEALTKLMSDSIDGYNGGSSTYEQSYSTIATVEKIDVLDNYKTENAYHTLENLKSSKAAYDAAEKLLAQEYYEDTILNYSNVISEDSYYSDSQTKIKEATKSIVSQVTSEISEMQKKKDYIGALELIEKTLLTVDAEAELGSLRNQITAECINNALSEAEEAFSNGKDYENAIKIITAAINTVGSDDRLSAELENYQSYIPVALTTIKPFAQGNYLSIGYAFKDIYSDVKGNSYPKDSIFYPNSGTSISSIPKSEDDGRVEYYIDGNYSALTGTLYLPYASRGADKAEMPSTFKVYGDGVLLYEAPEFRMGITEPLDFSVDISNVRSLKIVILGLWRENGDWIGTYYRYPMVCATNLMLSK